MSRLSLDQLKVETKNTNEGRLTLDQFKNQTSNNNDSKNEELEKLTGGVLGACHSWWDQVVKFITTEGHGGPASTSFYD